MHNGFVTICCDSYGEARELMVERYGIKWSFQYDDSNFKPQYFPLGSLEMWRPRLTAAMLSGMKPGELIAYGKVDDHRLGTHPVKWIAVHGKGGAWVIFYGSERLTFQRVLEGGSYALIPSIIRDLVPCDDDAFQLYNTNL